MNTISAIIRVPHDNGFESSKRGKCSLCRQKESKHKNLEIRKQLYESRLDHTPKCQSWATSIVGYRSLKKFYKEDHLDHVMRYSMFISVLPPGCRKCLMTFRDMSRVMECFRKHNCHCMRRK